MTERLYYADTYLTKFTARPVEHFAHEGRLALVLDRTAFYPTSGGQPFDMGVLTSSPVWKDGARVVDVWIREADEAIIHLLDTAPFHKEHQLPTQVTGQLDWERRFDHMQQHTGQHILSQAFWQVAQAETVSFHLGTESATIDLSGLCETWSDGTIVTVPDIEEHIAAVEQLSNAIVWQDCPVATQIVPPAQVARLPLRKPPAVSQDIRVIQVGEFDWSACGGTHVARSGEIGLIKVIKWERRGKEIRVEFLCGQRALADYQQKNSMVNHLAASFNVGHWELDQAVERLVEEAQDLRSRLRRAEQALLPHKVADLCANAPQVAGVRVVAQRLSGLAAENMRALAHELVATKDVIALLGTGEEKAQLCFARSTDVQVDLVPLVRKAAQRLGGRGGGGRPEFAQGGAPLTHARDLDAVLEWAAQDVYQQLENH